MRKSHCVASLLAAVALTGGLNSPIQAQVVGIGPFVPGPLAPVATPVDITFDSNINPPSANPFLPSFSQDAQNIIQAHQLARKQVQAAINYLISHRRQILAGEDKLYNDTFGDFYDPNSPFAGQYDRTITIDIFDQNGNVVGQQTVINTAHFDLVLNTFLTMLNAMAQPTLYSYGGPQFDPLFSTYAAMDPVIGEPLFGGPTPTSTGFDRGFREWGNSNSLSPAHLAQLQNNPGMALKWIDDNADVFALDPATGQVLIDPATGLPIKIDSLSNAFFKEKLGAYSEPNVDPITGLPLGTNTIFVGGAFLNQTTRDGALQDGSPTSELTPTELQQFQMIIQAFAQQAGAEPGLTELFGQNPSFTQAFDSGSYATFAGLGAGGVGDGDLLPPFGKNAEFNGDFLPVTPGTVGP